MPAGSPFHSAIITRNFGLDPNPSRRRSFSVQETAFSARSYSANSRMNDNISGMSLAVALRSFNMANTALHWNYLRLIYYWNNFLSLVQLRFDYLSKILRSVSKEKPTRTSNPVFCDG